MSDIKCPSCGRRNFRYLVKTKKYHCVPCGFEWEKEVEVVYEQD